MDHFSNFGGKNCFSKNSGSVTQNFVKVSSTMPKFRESNDLTPRKHPDSLQDERTDSHYFIRDLPATARDPVKKF